MARNLFPSRRSGFESQLECYQNEVDTFKEKEVPRHVEEIVAVVARLEELDTSLEAAKEEAMV